MRMHGTLHYGSLTGGCALFDKEYRFERRHFQEQRLNEKPIREYLKDTSGTASTAANYGGQESTVGNSIRLGYACTVCNI